MRDVELDVDVDEDVDEGVEPKPGRRRALGPREEKDRMNRLCKVLIADDERPVALGLQGQLEALGYDVVAVVDDGQAPSTSPAGRCRMSF